MSTPSPRRGATGVFTQVWDGYSLSERDRRWSAVCARAAEAGFDAIFVPIGDGINARYLTQFRASSVVLPTDGREPIVITDRGSRNAWLPEPRLTAREWSEPMAQALLDLGLDRAGIGVTGLRGGRFGHVSQPEGVVCHSAYAAVLQRLPNATFAEASDVLGAVRYLKSDEELASIRQAAAIAEAGRQTFLEHVGTPEPILRARILGRMLALGSEYYPLRLEGATAEIHAVWGTQVVTIVETAPSCSDELFKQALGHIHPGAPAPMGVTLQSIGSGDDGPLITHADTEFRFEPNTAFTLHAGPYARPIAVAEAGAVELGY